MLLVLKENTSQVFDQIESAAAAAEKPLSEFLLTMLQYCTEWVHNMLSGQECFKGNNWEAVHATFYRFLWCFWLKANTFNLMDWRTVEDDDSHLGHPLLIQRHAKDKTATSPSDKQAEELHQRDDKLNPPRKFITLRLFKMRSTLKLVETRFSTWEFLCP